MKQYHTGIYCYFISFSFSTRSASSCDSCFISIILKNFIVSGTSWGMPWNQRNSFWISVSSATEYPSFWQMDSICLFGIPVLGLFEFKISDIWQQLGYRTKLRTIGLMALPLVSHSDVFVNHFL